MGKHFRGNIMTEKNEFGNQQPPPYPGGFQVPTQPNPYPQQPSAQYQPNQRGEPIVQIQVGPSSQLGPHPANVTCSRCKSSIQTRVESEPSPTAWIIGGILCVFGFWCCACIPCCVDSLKAVTHTCPNPDCKAFIGRYKGGI